MLIDTLSCLEQVQFDYQDMLLILRGLDTCHRFSAIFTRETTFEKESNLKENNFLL